MKKYKHLIAGFFFLALTISFGFLSCKPGSEGRSSKSRKQDSIIVLTSNLMGKGKAIEIEMIKGKSHNHPSFAIWLEDTSGNYLQTLFVTKTIAQGVFNYGDKSTGYWKPGEIRRPSALPYWIHKRGVLNEYRTLEPTPDNKVADAYSGATPKGSFKLSTRSDKQLYGKVKLLLEINQTWDWNEYWYNGLYPGEIDYNVSCQPALVFAAIVDIENSGTEIELKPVGHSHHSGKNGNLYQDLTTISTALHIFDKISVRVK